MKVVKFLFISVLILAMFAGCGITAQKSSKFLYLNGYYYGCYESGQEVCASISEGAGEELRCVALQERSCKTKVEGILNGTR